MYNLIPDRPLIVTDYPDEEQFASIMFKDTLEKIINKDGTVFIKHIVLYYKPGEINESLPLEEQTLDTIEERNDLRITEDEIKTIRDTEEWSELPIDLQKKILKY